MTPDNIVAACSKVIAERYGHVIWPAEIRCIVEAVLRISRPPIAAEATAQAREAALEEAAGLADEERRYLESIDRTEHGEGALRQAISLAGRIRSLARAPATGGQGREGGAVVNPDHDITRDPDEEPVCDLCEGTGEVSVESPGGTRSTECCPHCMWQEREADVARLEAAVACAFKAGAEAMRLACISSVRISHNIAEAYGPIGTERALAAVDKHLQSLPIPTIPPSAGEATNRE